MCIILPLKSGHLSNQDTFHRSQTCPHLGVPLYMCCLVYIVAHFVYVCMCVATCVNTYIHSCIIIIYVHMPIDVTVFMHVVCKLVHLHNSLCQVCLMANLSLVMSMENRDIYIFIYIFIYIYIRTFSLKAHAQV